MTYNIIATGSTGNAVLLNGNILIDCGVPLKKLEPYIKDLRLVLLTHAHGDHFKASTVRALHKQHPALRWGCCEWMVGPLLEAGVDKHVIDVFLPGMQQGYVVDRFAGMDGAPEEASIQAIEIPHDVRNCCYLIEFPKEKKRVFYATDCATLDGIEAKDYDYYFIERNYEDSEIEARIAAKHAAGKMAYETNVIHNHLSEKQAVDWLAANDSRFPNGNYIFLHQHTDKERKNNGETGMD